MRFLTFLFLLFSTIISIAQGSYNLKIETQSDVIWDVAANRNGKKAILLDVIPNGFNDPYSSVFFLENSNILEGIKFNIINEAPFFTTLKQIDELTIVSTFPQGLHSFSEFLSFTGFVIYNSESGSISAKKTQFDDSFLLNKASSFSFCKIESSNAESASLLVAQSNPSHNTELGFHFLDFDGEELSSFGLYLLDVYPLGEYVSVSTVGDDVIFCGNQYRSQGGYFGKMDKEGENRMCYSSINFSPVQIYSDSKAIYMLSKTNELNLYSRNIDDLVISKFDIDFNLLWSKGIHADYFNYQNANFSIRENGEIVLSYSSVGDISYINAEFSSQGELLKQQGLSKVYSGSNLSNNNSFAIAYTNVDINSIATANFESFIYVGDDLSDFEECGILSSCLQVNDFEIEFSSIASTKKELPKFIDVGVEYDNIYRSTSTSCENINLPNPIFESVDSFCIGETLVTSDSNSEISFTEEWQIKNENGEVFVTNSRQLEYVLISEGAYTIVHTIYLLGCPYEFEKQVYVRPEPNIEIEDEVYFCHSDGNTIKVNTDNVGLDIRWSTGAQDNTTEIFESGTYAVTVCDDYCCASAQIEVNIVDDLFNQEAILDMPKDLKICQNQLPFILKPKSSYSDEFTLNFDGESRSDFKLTKAGQYFVSVKFHDCEFYESFNLEVDSCFSAVYIPSAFSPNNDGVNDVFAPLGENFLSKKLSIYDRWGNKVFESRNGSTIWNGSFKGQEVPVGVYVYAFIYLDTLTDIEYEIKGDLTLLK